MVHSLERFTEKHSSLKLLVALFTYVVIIIHFLRYLLETQDFDFRFAGPELTGA